MEPGIRKVFLNPGEFIFGEWGTCVHTVLGSCIAICLWHPVLRIGGMCHFILPSRPRDEAPSSELDGRYGDEAMRLFDLAIKLHHTEYEQYQAKIFGGGKMFNCARASEERLIGEKNVAKAEQLIRDRKIEIGVVHVGEQNYQHIVMDIAEGNVWVRNQVVKDGYSKKPSVNRIRRQTL